LKAEEEKNSKKPPPKKGKEAVQEEKPPEIDPLSLPLTEEEIAAALEVLEFPINEFDEFCT